MFYIEKDIWHLRNMDIYDVVRVVCVMVFSIATVFVQIAFLVVTNNNEYSDVQNFFLWFFGVMIKLCLIAARKEVFEDNGWF